MTRSKWSGVTCGCRGRCTTGAGGSKRRRARAENWLRDDRRTGYSLDGPAVDAVSRSQSVRQTTGGCSGAATTCCSTAGASRSSSREVGRFYEAFRDGREVALAHPRPYRDYIAVALQPGSRERRRRSGVSVLRGFAAPTRWSWPKPRPRRGRHQRLARRSRRSAAHGGHDGGTADARAAAQGDAQHHRPGGVGADPQPVLRAGRCACSAPPSQAVRRSWPASRRWSVSSSTRCPSVCASHRKHGARRLAARRCRNSRARLVSSSTARSCRFRAGATCRAARRCSRACSCSRTIPRTVPATGARRRSGASRSTFRLWSERAIPSQSPSFQVPNCSSRSRSTAERLERSAVERMLGHLGDAARPRWLTTPISRSLRCRC